MVEDATGLGYTISVGTPIGTAGGVVKTIEPDRVVVDEEFVDFYGEKKKTERVLKLKPEGEKRP
jgi:Tfp pilus assembly protein PilP